MKLMDTTTRRPGSRALEAVKDVSDVVFKKPVGVAKRRSLPTILNEEVYIKKMGEIIGRDFFPYLEKLQAQNAYIDAVEQNDTKRMRELYAKYSFGRPGTDRLNSPATFETPVRDVEADDVSTPQSVRPKSPTITEEHKESLDEYLSNHTSEDNASFKEVVADSAEKFKLKFPWLYKANDSSMPLAIENKDVSDSNKPSKPFELDTWGYKNKNYIMYIPDGVELTSQEKIELAKQKREIMHENTRLKVNPFNEQHNKQTISNMARVQSRTNDGKIGVDGKEILKNGVPSVNGFNFVATPSPRPGECESPIMTWGQIEGTPFRLDGGDTPLLHSSQGPSFHMSAPPKRERLAWELAEKASEKNRDRKHKALEAARKSLSTPSPRSTIDRLSPAARRLATHKLRLSITPTPHRRSLPTPLFAVKTPNTPRTETRNNRSETKRENTTKSQDAILTDNLLNLPQRQRASDFFNN